MKDNSAGQDSKVWNEWWGDISPLSEIRMWDFYGGRQWILKYVPRFGKVIEAGCGLGRYVFILRRLGIDAEGIDFLDTAIDKLNAFKNKIDPLAEFHEGDILKLPFSEDSISAYLSFGVLEHFIEGPQKAIAEAFRILYPGGIAIITTPNYSWYVLYKNMKQRIVKIIKILTRKNVFDKPFFNYVYTPNQLKHFIEEQGFYVSRADSCDLLYTFFKFGFFNGNNNRINNLIAWLAFKLENSMFKKFGAQSITISVKKAQLMHCFLCGAMNATPESLERFDVPIGKDCQTSQLARLYLKNTPIKLKHKYSVSPTLRRAERVICSISKKEFLTDDIFENFGFDIPVSPEELRRPENNIILCVNHLKPIWRRRNVDL